MKERCKHCGKTKGDHQAKTLNCPAGLKTRIGYINFDPQLTYEWNGKKIKDDHLYRL